MHSIWACRILGTCKTYCNQISIWTCHTISLHPLVKIMLDHRSQTSTSCFLKTHVIFGFLQIGFWGIAGRGAAAAGRWPAHV